MKLKVHVPVSIVRGAGLGGFVGFKGDAKWIHVHENIL